MLFLKEITKYIGYNKLLNNVGIIKLIPIINLKQFIQVFLISTKSQFLIPTKLVTAETLIYNIFPDKEGVRSHFI